MVFRSISDASQSLAPDFVRCCQICDFELHKRAENRKICQSCCLASTLFERHQVFSLPKDFLTCSARVTCYNPDFARKKFCLGSLRMQGGHASRWQFKELEVYITRDNHNQYHLHQRHGILDVCIHLSNPHTFSCFCVRRLGPQSLAKNNGSKSMIRPRHISNAHPTPTFCTSIDGSAWLDASPYMRLSCATPAVQRFQTSFPL